LLLDGCRVEADIVLGEGWDSAFVEKSFHGKGPDVEPDEWAEKGFVGEEGGHGGRRVVVCAVKMGAIAGV